MPTVTEQITDYVPLERWIYENQGRRPKEESIVHINNEPFVKVDKGIRIKETQ